jgi:hypothetical protein
MYLAYNYQPILLNGTIHAGIFASGLAGLYYFFTRKLTARLIAWYVAGALPVHLAIHFAVIGDLAQLTGVSHILLNFWSLP